MQTQTITCPSCGTTIELSETLAHPFVEAVRAELGAKLQAAQDEATKAKADLAKEKADIETQRADIAAQIARGISAKRTELEASVREEVETELRAEVDSKNKRIEKLLADLKGAKEDQLKLEQDKQDLELRAQSIDLEITKAVTAKLDALKAEAEQQAEESYRLKIAELNKKLEDTTEKLEEAKKKAQQGSVQLQGEVLELDFQATLSQTFPWDEIHEVKKGQRGADCIHLVNSGLNQRAGSISWETKRTQNWGSDWIIKLKGDSRDAKTDVAVIVSEILPQGIESFGLVEGIWVVKPSMAIPLAYALRETILKTSEARKAAEGKQTQAGAVYDYVTGPEFRARLEGIADPFRQMQCDLASERRQAEIRFSKRQKQIDRVLQSCFSMVGDLHGIAGQDIAELEAVEMKSLVASIEDDAPASYNGDHE